MRAGSLNPRRAIGLLATVTAIAVVLAGGQAASADQALPGPVTLYVTGFDPELAAANGYELRTDGTGKQVVVSASNDDGDFTGAVALPDNLQPRPPGIILPFNTAIGECGSSWIYFVNSNRYRTGFSINASYGNAIWRTWDVTKSATAGSSVDGFASIMNASSWEEQRNFSLGGSNRRVEVTNGWVATAFGFTCTSGDPWDTW